MIESDIINKYNINDYEFSSTEDNYTKICQITKYIENFCKIHEKKESLGTGLGNLLIKLKLIQQMEDFKMKILKTYDLMDLNGRNIFKEIFKDYKELLELISQAPSEIENITDYTTLCNNLHDYLYVNEINYPESSMTPEEVLAACNETIIEIEKIRDMAKYAISRKQDSSTNHSEVNILEPTDLFFVMGNSKNKIVI